MTRRDTLLMWAMGMLGGLFVAHMVDRVAIGVAEYELKGRVPVCYDSTFC